MASCAHLQAIDPVSPRRATNARSASRSARPVHLRTCQQDGGTRCCDTLAEPARVQARACDEASGDRFRRTRGALALLLPGRPDGGVPRRGSCRSPAGLLASARHVSPVFQSRGRPHHRGSFVGMLLCQSSAGGWDCVIAGSNPITTSIGAAEGAVFGILGLFRHSRSRGGERFDERRHQIVDEANAIENAWLRVDVLRPADRARSGA